MAHRLRLKRKQECACLHVGVIQTTVIVLLCYHKSNHIASCIHVCLVFKNQGLNSAVPASSVFCQNADQVALECKTVVCLLQFMYLRGLCDGAVLTIANPCNCTLWAGLVY